MFRIALAVFKKNEAEILTTRDSADLYETLGLLGSTEYDCDELMYMGFKKIGTMRRGQLNRMREAYRIEVSREFAERQKRLEMLRK